MDKRLWRTVVRPAFWAGCFLLGFSPAVFAADQIPGAEESPKPTAEQSPGDDQASRSFLQLQGQIHSALLVIEHNRQETEASARRNAETVATRLTMLEQTFTSQREREMDLIQNSNRFILFATVTFGALGLLTLLFISWFWFRALNRFTQAAAALPAAPRGLESRPAASALIAGNSSLAGVGSLDSPGPRLLGAIERLEKQVCELESVSRTPPLPSGNKMKGEASDDGDGTSADTDSRQDPAQVERQERISLMLGKGQTLLNLEQPQEAIACFDAVVELDPTNSEALVKKGVAMERLKKLEEALECYDRAIAINSSSTLAYLYKGGIFNQLERFSDALQCYEQALRTQQKQSVS